MYESIKRNVDVAGPATPAKRMLCIILSFNGLDDTLSCIKSILDQKQIGLELLIIDNASAAGVVDAISMAYPAIELIALPENLGWAGGNNVGIEIGLKRNYEWICLLNNDIEFPPGQLARWFNATTDLPPCLLHPTIYYWDQPETAQLDPRNQVLEIPGTILTTWHGKTAIHYAYGACLAVHNQIFRAVGTFDERLFLQLEETDFHFRAVAKGYQSVCDTEVKIFHKESRAFGGRHAPIKIYYNLRNTLLVIEKKQEKFKRKLLSYKELYWTVREISKTDQRIRNRSEQGLMFWLVSSSPHAIAARLGIRDYVLRRFGKISVKAHEKIKTSEIRLAKPATS